VEVWAHETSLTPPLFIEVPVLSQEIERSYTCVLDVSILPLSNIIFCWILQLFRQCDICLFFILLSNTPVK
jgi:hypothetical protein